MKQKIKVQKAVELSAWYQKDKDNLGALSIKSRWNLKKNMLEIDKIARQFTEFKESTMQEFRDSYINNDKTFREEDQDGRELFKIKPEFVEDWRKEMGEINAKLAEVADEENEIELHEIDMEAEIERMPEDAVLSDAAMNALMMFMPNKEV